MKVTDDIGDKNSCSLQACLKYVTRFARWCGFFPIQGLNQPTAAENKFKIKCLYGFYNIGTIIGQAMMLFFSIFYSVYIEVSMLSLNYIISNVSTLISAILLARLAKRWPKLLEIAAETEHSLILLELDNNTIKKSSIIACVMIAIALVEHILSMNFAIKLIMGCFNETRFIKIFAIYTEMRTPYAVEYLSNSAFSATLALIFDFQGNFTCSFIDTLTICLSIYIISYFYNLDKTIRSKRNNSTISWSQLREHYSKLALLVKKIDDELSLFILLSFLTDLYFVCLQLFYLLNKSDMDFDGCETETFKNLMTSPDYFLYYYTSFLFLILRVLCRSMFAASVHIAGQKPIIPVCGVQSAEYDDEVLRFQLILRFTTVALSGKFFYVTRNTILQVIGAIITYELVLLQFRNIPYEDNSVNNTIATNETIICV